MVLVWISVLITFELRKLELKVILKRENTYDFFAEIVTVIFEIVFVTFLILLAPVFINH